MNGLHFIKQKQSSWAQRQGFELVSGTIGADGEKTYLQNVADNLFEPLTQDSADSYNAGDGGETKDTANRLAKMKAVHSSSAIVVNLFQYWKGKDISPLMYALNLRRKPYPDTITENAGTDAPDVSEISPKENAAKIYFEKKFRISDDTVSFRKPANLDVVIEEPLCHTAIESKFTEPYGNSHEGLREAYIRNESLWTELPNLYDLAKQISPDNKLFKHLDAAQLVKHILGLSANYREKRVKFRLLYLWYDVLGEEGAEHRREIEQFASIAKKDNILFRHITYQEVIATLAKDYREGNEAYIDYLTERYL